MTTTRRNLLKGLTLGSGSVVFSPLINQLTAQAAGKAAFPAADANVDAFFKQADGEAERLAATRAGAAARHLREAYACWTALR